MGWTFTNYGYYACDKPQTLEEKKNFVANEVKSWYNGEAVILHDHIAYDPYVSDKGGYVYYCSLERPDQRRIILVNLVVFDKDEWGYKDMSEDMGPGYHDCPLIILKDVPCPDDQYAIEWRKEVMERHYNEIAKKAAIKNLQPGDMVEFINCNYGGQKKFVVAYNDGRKVYFVGDRGKVNLVKWKKTEFKIIKAN